MPRERRYVSEVLTRSQGRLRPVGEGRYSIEVPQELRRGGYAKNQIPAATFDRALASSAETEDLEFLGISHPLAQSVSVKVRAGLFDPQGLFAKDRIGVRVVAGAPAVGILFTHLGLIYQKRYREGREVDLPYAEYIPVPIWPAPSSPRIS